MVMSGGNMERPQDTPQAQKKADDAPEPQPPAPRPGGCLVEIRVSGHLDSAWATWLDAAAVRTLDSGETLLTAHVQDQAALLGTLMKLHGLGIRILAFNPATRCACEASTPWTDGRARRRTEVTPERKIGRAHV
jgi:hypothetical protein